MKLCKSYSVHSLRKLTIHCLFVGTSLSTHPYGIFDCFISPSCRAESDRKRYQKEMENYTPPERDGENKKRSKTGYNMFFSAYVLQLKQSAAGVPPERGSVARLVGNAWKVRYPLEILINHHSTLLFYLGIPSKTVRHYISLPIFFEIILLTNTHIHTQLRS